MEQAKIRPSVTLYSLDRSLPTLIIVMALSHEGEALRIGFSQLMKPRPVSKKV